MAAAERMGVAMAPVDVDVEEGKASAVMMKRELSVDDLFGPLNRLDVRHPSASAEVEPLLNSRVADARLPDAESRVPSLEAHRTQPVLPGHDRASSAARLCPVLIMDMAPIPEENGSISHSEKPCIPVLGLTIGGKPEEGNPAVAVSMDHVRTSKVSSITSKSNVSVSDGMGLQMQGNSTSDEDQQVLDDRKQRRMLSNRESARRSRLRKQQHLDELRGHVAQLRAQNNQMLNSFNLASQQFIQVTEENRKLRSEAMDLSHQLQQLHHTVTSQRANNGLVHRMDAVELVQGPQY